ncbi:MAG: molybdopterin biosynthesis protein [Candidatus Atribacteria bacterium]|nr:molybdopterin biosynthesis protein [Candidatus Atribacteria bacterium]
MKRNIYLSKLSLKEAQEKFTKVLANLKINQPLKGELVFTEDSLGRVTAEPAFAKISSPYYQAAAMDGVVVRARDTYHASESSPLMLRIGKDFYFINTGNPIPFEFDAVIKIEDINPVGEIGQRKMKKKDITDELTKMEEKNIKEIMIFSSAFPGQHIRNIGEDIVANQLIIPVNQRIRPVDVGVLLAGGINQLLVRRRPKVIVIPTGDELIQPGERIIPGKIIEYNSKIIKGLISEWGGEAQVYEIVKDIPGHLKKILLKAAPQNDMVVVIAGSSAGSKDFTPEIVKNIGEVLVHGVAIMPGKPTILGIINKTPLIGLPGYPVSAIISAEQFLKPLIFKRLGLTIPKRKEIKVHMAHKVVSRLGDEEFLRVKLGNIGEKIMAYPLPRGSGVITSLVEADGIIRIPSLREGLDFEEEVNVELWKDLNTIMNNIIIAGSHDLILDVLKNELQEDLSDYRLVSFNVGSMGGLMALKQNRTHLATAHLLDPESGEYNFPYLKKVLPQKELIVVDLAYREQGIMVKKGNPKNIKELDDLTREDIKFINRQKGSGTRILLDYLLKKKAINPMDIKGYFQEEFTHLMVASAVATGIVDAGLGILSAAKAFHLDFVLMAKERYDIIIPKENYSSLKIQKLLTIIKSEKFKKKVLSLGGYDLSQSGKVMEE